MKPITHWVQNDAIDAIVNEYGAQLEKISPDNRRVLISILAIDTLETEDSSDDVRDVAELFTGAETFNRYEKDLLIEAIAASLVQGGNPWLQAGREQVAIVQAHVCQT